MTTDQAILLLIAELRQRVAAVEAENAQLRAALEQAQSQADSTS